jgi:hypothetical protein
VRFDPDLGAGSAPPPVEDEAVLDDLIDDLSAA